MKCIKLNDVNKKNDSLEEIPINPYETLLNLYNGKEQDEQTHYLKKEIKKKINSYKSQDKLKRKYDIEKFIGYDTIIDKLIKSELKCFYCKKEVLLFYSKKKERLQWSLERLNNNIGHNSENTCISCLDCNLRRRTDNYEYFKNSKQMIIKKNSL